jgi:hypothetical protein
VRAWQEWGWTIALHGFQHRYVSKNAGLVAVRKKSEFAGLPVETQREKLRRGMEIFAREGIKSRVWIAPGNAFDAATVALLPEFGINVISAGYFQFPYVSRVTSPSSAAVPAASSGGVPPPEATRGETPREPAGVDACATRSDASLISNARHWITWMPQQMHYFRPAPAGVWTVCYHHNGWDSTRLQTFRQDVDDHAPHITSLDDVLDQNVLRECNWSAWLCTHPRLSEFLIRSELKLWAMTRGRGALDAGRGSRPHGTRHRFTDEDGRLKIEDGKVGVSASPSSILHRPSSPPRGGGPG